jgi:hypothetical protein
LIICCSNVIDFLKPFETNLVIALAVAGYQGRARVNL